MSSALNSTVTASLAVDGSPQGTLYLHNKYWCAATSLSTDPWWRVDLGRSYIVDEVKIVSRVDGDGSGLTNFEIRIGWCSWLRKTYGHLERHRSAPQLEYYFDTIQKVSFEWSHWSVSSTDSKYRITLYSIIISTTGKYGSIAFIWIVTL